MSYFWLLSLAALAINVILVAYIVSKGPKGPAAQVYVLLLSAFSLLAAPQFVVRAVPQLEPSLLLTLVRVEWTGISLIPGFIAHFVLVYPRRSPFLDRPWALLLLYTPSIVFVSFLWAGNLLVAGVVEGPLGPDALLGQLYLPLATVYALVILAGVAHLGRSYLREPDVRARTRYRLLMLGLGIAILGGTVTEVYGTLLLQVPTRFGLGTVWITIFAAFAAVAFVRYGFLVIEPVTEEVAAGRVFAWERGRNYLVLERSRRTSFQAFRGVAQEVPGLCVTAFPPHLLAAEYALRKTPFLWLSSQEGHELSLKPTYLEVDVLQTVLKFLRDNPGAALLLDDLEYLAQVNGFKAVLRTLSRSVAAASKYGCTLLASLNPSSLDPVQVSALQALFDEVHVGEDGGELPHLPLVAPGCVLWEGRREDCFAALAQAPAEGKIVASTLFPEKLREGYGLAETAFLWLAPETHQEFRTYNPARLTLEVLRDLVHTMRPRALVYIGELEVLVEEAGFLEVLEYTKLVVDAAIHRSSLVVASVRTDAVPGQVLSMLEKRFAGTAG